MKKKLLPITLLCLVGLIGAGCGGKKKKVDPTPSPSGEPTQAASSSADPTIGLVRQLVNAMKVDQYSYLLKGFKTSFSQDYEVSYSSSTQFTNMEYSLKHSSSGELSRFYEPIVKESLDSRYDEGRGYFGGQQSESVNFLRKVTNKEDSAVENRKANYDYNHNFGIKYDENYLLVSGYGSLNDKLNQSNSVSNEFKGKIAKDFIGTYSNSYLDSVVDNVLYLDAWDDVFTFINYRMEYYQKADFESDESIKNLIKDLSFEVSENETKIEIDFKIKSSKIIKDLYDKDINTASVISGKYVTNKESGRIESYEYDLKDYFSAILSLGSQSKDQYSYKVNDFKVRGLNLNTTFDALAITGPLDEYDEENASIFSDSFNDIIVPHIEDVMVIE